MTGARFTSSGALANGNFSFDDTVGAVIEAEFRSGSQFGLKLRYVAEKYRFSGADPFTLDGAHIGVLVHWYLSE